MCRRTHCMYACRLCSLQDRNSGCCPMRMPGSLAPTYRNCAPHPPLSSLYWCFACLLILLLFQLSNPCQPLLSLLTTLTLLPPLPCIPVLLFPVGPAQRLAFHAIPPPPPTPPPPTPPHPTPPHPSPTPTPACSWSAHRAGVPPVSSCCSSSSSSCSCDPHASPSSPSSPS